MPMTAKDCCCGTGGCNGWFLDDECLIPSSGFDGSYDYKCTCFETATCDGVDIQTNCGCDEVVGTEDAGPCCGPGTPSSVTFGASVFWDWGWNRLPFGITCQGYDAPNTGGSPDTDPPVPIPECAHETWEVWSPASPSGSAYSGWDWVQGGSIIGMVFSESNDIAVVAGSEVPAGCCATYYYGAVDVVGPPRKPFVQNPWGYGVAHFSDLSTYSPPPGLRAYGRLAIQYAGEGPNNSGVQPRLTCLVKLEIIIGLTGYGDHWIKAIDGGALPTDSRTQVATLIAGASVNVTACNCSGIGDVEPDIGVHVLDKINWNNMSTAASWNYAWPHASPGVSGNSDTAAWPTTWDVGPDPRAPYPNPCGGDCTAETFSLSAFSCCTDAACPLCSGTTGCGDNCQPHCWRSSNAVNFFRTNQGLRVWTVKHDLIGSQTKFGSTEPHAANRETSFFCYAHTQDNPCAEFLGNKINTNHIMGGYKSAGPALAFPNPGLTDITITNIGYFG